MDEGLGLTILLLAIAFIVCAIIFVNEVKGDNEYKLRHIVLFILILPVSLLVMFVWALIRAIKEYLLPIIKRGW